MTAASAAPSAHLVSFVSGGGVRIHSDPNPKSTVVGLAYCGDNWAELAGAAATPTPTAQTPVPASFVAWSHLRDCYEWQAAGRRQR
ncbi:hypothetical protein [Streptomyces sp. NPDC055056]